ncbi:MAG TPA: GNAT family N-acetyltransferase [Pyrinomonadaceae bacterium]|nr:GNAT family N-acetyltransferase [Pyrinomonadaceae bacterium]
MPNIRPLKRIAGKVRDIRDSHRERHRPSGFGFALADSVEYLDAARWDSVAENSSLFLSRRYLRVVEEVGPENLQPRYALVFRGRDAVACVAAQSARITAARVRKKKEGGRASKVSAPLERIEERVLVCGNLLSWGQHGVAFARGEDPARLWPAVAEALYRLRRADRLHGETDLVMVKDLSDAEAAEASALGRFSYRPLETDPDMVLEISPSWRTFDDYLASLTSKYRKTARQIIKDVEAAGCVVEEITDVASNQDEIHALYMQTHEHARLRLFTLRPEYLPTLAERLGDDMRFTVVRKDGRLLGFVTTVRDNDLAVGYYIGFDRPTNAEAPLYFRLLYSVVGHAVEMNCRRLSLGRTALEPKARLGARPSPMRVLVRHRIPALNVLVRALLRSVDHDEAPERNPFK